jgi:septum formation topological specificity factor MinE
MEKKTLIAAYEEFIDNQTERNKMSKTVENKTNDILEAIEEYICYDMSEAEFAEMRKKEISAETIYVLIKLLVDKGLLSFDDIVKTLRK